MSDTEARKQAMRNSIELPPLHPNNIEPTSEPYSHLNPLRRKELLPSILSTSPPGRSSTLPPIQRSSGPTRPRKQSVSKRAREPQHKRQKSRGEQAHLRRMSYDRKAFSAEPSSALSAAYGKRWEDLIDAATSATEEDEERTPVDTFLILEIVYNSDNYRYLRPPSPSIVLRCRHFPHPTFRAIKPHLFNKPSPLHSIFPTPLNHFPLSRAVEKAVIISILNLAAFPIHPQAFHLLVRRYTVPRVGAFHYSKNHMPVQNVYAGYAKLALTFSWRSKGHGGNVQGVPQ